MHHKDMFTFSCKFVSCMLGVVKVWVVLLSRQDRVMSSPRRAQIAPALGRHVAAWTGRGGRNREPRSLCNHLINKDQRTPEKLQRWQRHSRVFVVPLFACVRECERRTRSPSDVPDRRRASHSGGRRQQRRLRHSEAGAPASFAPSPRLPVE